MVSTSNGSFGKTQSAFGIIQALNASNVPAAAGANPTFRVFTQDMEEILSAAGTAVPFDSPTVTGAYLWSVDLSAAEFERGEHYIVLATYTVGGNARNDFFTFQVA